MARKREGFVPIGDLVIDLPGVPVSSAPRRRAPGAPPLHAARRRERGGRRRGFHGAAARAVQSAAPQRNRLEGVRRRERRIERRGSVVFRSGGRAGLPEDRQPDPPLLCRGRGRRKVAPPVLLVESSV